MSWQLWVVVAAVAGALLVLLVLRFRRAQRVFDQIIDQLDDTGTADPGGDLRAEHDARAENNDARAENTVSAEADRSAAGRSTTSGERARQVDEVARQRRRHTARPTIVPAHGHRTRPHR
jgi:hypothetical protein